MFVPVILYTHTHAVSDRYCRCQPQFDSVSARERKSARWNITTSGRLPISSQRRGNKIASESDTRQLHAPRLSLSPICINLTSSNLQRQNFLSADRPSVARWVRMSAESERTLAQKKEDVGAHYGSPWTHFPLIGDRRAAPEHGPLCFGVLGLLSLINDF